MRWIFMILVLGFLSCKKADPVEITSVTSAPSISLWGQFLLLEGRMYLDNHETGSKIMYQHFGPNKSISSLRYDGSMFDIENLAQGVTTYSFYKPQVVASSGRFVLNGDSTRVYGLTYSTGFSSITENPAATQPSDLFMGGSARPFTFRTLDYDNKVIIIRIEEVEASIGGQNTRYFTELRMKKIREW